MADQKATKLLPCPFCGGNETVDFYEPRNWGWYRVCKKCGASTTGDSLMEADADWNRRVPVWRNIERDGLPSGSGKYLVTIEDFEGQKIVEMLEFEIEKNQWKPNKANGRSVIAYMPLPEAAK